MRNINDPAYYDGDTGQWTPVPLADMSVRELARTALGLADLIISGPDVITEEALACVAIYKRELRARGIGPTRLTTGERSG